MIKSSDVGTHVHGYRTGGPFFASPSHLLSFNLQNAPRRNRILPACCIYAVVILFRVVIWTVTGGNFHGSWCISSDGTDLQKKTMRKRRAEKSNAPPPRVRSRGTWGIFSPGMALYLHHPVFHRGCEADSPGIPSHRRGGISSSITAPYAPMLKIFAKHGGEEASIGRHILRLSSHTKMNTMGVKSAGREISKHLLESAICIKQVAV